MPADPSSPAAGTPTPRPPESTDGADGSSGGGVGDVLTIEDIRNAADTLATEWTASEGWGESDPTVAEWVSFHDEPPHPLAMLVCYLRAGGKPPLAWVVEHGTDLQPLWDSCPVAGTLLDLLHAADHPDAWRAQRVVRRLLDLATDSYSADDVTACVRRVAPTAPTLAQLLAPPAKGSPP
jgi:hypothetical protein